MVSLRSLAILALALPFAATASGTHGSPPEGDHGAPAHAAPRSGPDCPRRLGDQEGAPRFADFPAPRAIRASAWVAPRLSSRDVRMYRSTLGAEVANGPNFAANYTIAAASSRTNCAGSARATSATGSPTGRSALAACAAIRTAAC